MARRTPAIVRAELLARVHYGLPPINQSLTGHPRGVRKMVFCQLESGGFMQDGKLTDQAYLELAETCRKLRK